ncbi:MAG: tetratricopeptide repeat protein [Desulfobacter sp.]|nr:MAG: tetratricopeptide repeat protein [Desulfobacter sp.]
MRELATTYRGVFFRAVLLMALFWGYPGAAMAKYPLVKTMLIKGSPLSVEFEVTGKAPVKVIRISEKEVLIALKNVALAKGFQVKGKNNPALSAVNVETLDGNVVAVVLAAKKAYDKIESSFNSSNTRLTVGLEALAPAPMPVPEPEKPKAVPAPQETGKKQVPPPPESEVSETSAAPEPAEKAPAPKPAPVRAVEKPAAQPAPPKPKAKPKPKPVPKAVPKAKQAAAPKAPPVYVPPKRTRSEFRGDISDIHRGKDPMMGCDSKAVDRAVLLIKKDLYKDAYKVLDQYMFQENFACLEQVYYLKAYTYYKSIEDEDFAKLIRAERMFQDALVSYSQSNYVPFAYAAMGMIQSRLKNNSAAEGYFNIVRKAYPDYTGMPEIEYYLATIYDEKGYTDKALRMYKKVFQSPLDNSYITDAGVGYGKALFRKRQYFDSLSVLNYVVKNDIKKVYESSDLLLYTGDANFELGLSRGARESYMRVMNLFPDIPNRDMLLSKVGDAFSMENKDKKALKIYELVREKFPDTPGFINASIGIARYLKTDPEKIEIYQMVKTRFPDNTYARIAMMRLAEIYQKQGEYDKCIKEIEDLLSTHPRGLRYEAVKLMQRAYEALFKEQLKNDEYTSVLNRYEQESVKLDKMSSRLIAFRVGMAYLRADLYEEAFNQLISAYKRYKRARRPAELLYGLGVAMDESGRDEDALKLLSSFSKRFPKHKDRAAVLTRMGRIYIEKKNLSRADAQFKKAYVAAKNSFDRGGILMYHSQVYEKKGDLKTSSALLERAVKAYASAKGNHYEELTDSYKTLGNTYLDMKSYVRAAEAYAKALDFSQGDRAKANIGFLLGDAYQKGNVLDKAKQTFEHVAQTYDSVWARLAQQRLSTLDLAGKMINS